MEVIRINDGYYIKSLLKNKNLKIKYVAEKMGIAASSLSAKLNGYRKFKKREIDILISMLEMSYEDVFQVKTVSLINNENNFVILNNTKYHISSSAFQSIESIIKKDTITT